MRPSSARQRKGMKLLMSSGLQHYERKTDHEKDFWSEYELCVDRTQTAYWYEVVLPGDALPVESSGGYCRHEDNMVEVLDLLRAERKRRGL